MQAKLHSVSCLSCLHCFLARWCYSVCVWGGGAGGRLSALHGVVLFPILSSHVGELLPLLDGHTTGVFPVLVIANAAAMSIHIQVSL